MGNRRKEELKKKIKDGEGFIANTERNEKMEN